AEFGAPVTADVGARQTAAAQRRDWAEPLREARGMLREGRPVQARSVLKRARRLAGDDVDAGRQIEALAEEVDRAIRAAQQRWRQATTDAAAGHHASALELVEWLARHAADIDILRRSGPGLAEALENSRRSLDAAPSDVGAVSPAGPVSAERTTDGSILVSWLPSPESGASYRVVRHTPGGRPQTVGRTDATELEDGGSPGGDVPVYEVTTIVDGRHSVSVRSGETVEPAAPVGRRTRALDPGLPPVGGVAATADRVTFVWPPGVTEVMVVIGGNGPPNAPDDPSSTPRKVTITRYELDGGFVIPAELTRPCHVAVASCRRDDAGGLVIASSFGPNARAVAADEGRP
ncbi:MAG: Ig-like domain repeat protein, partial [Gordonia sp. (in: high G+C Gram-positive bacteria)]|nr:Ig-like domain repeat protein [Gordonia sp. (in: high G+C Gram-positive bacteria)]